jgi:hypothetical protein
MMALCSLDDEFNTELEAAGKTIGAALSFDEALHRCWQEAQRLARGFEDMHYGWIAQSLIQIVKAQRDWPARQLEDIEHLIRVGARSQDAGLAKRPSGSNGHNGVGAGTEALAPGERSQKQTGGKKPRFTLVRFEDITVNRDPVYLIDGLIPRGGLIVVWGPPKCGKSFWLLDGVMHIALGWPYHGRSIQQGSIVYLALEGGSGFTRRVEAFKQHHRVANAPFFLITDRANLITDHRALIEDIRNQTRSETPVLVAIDTLNRSLGGSESKDEDMAKYIQAADAIREAFGCAVVIVHHCGVDESRPRGHTSLGGAVDAQIAIRRDAAGNVVAEVEWMKDGPEGDRVVSRLDHVDLGLDNAGKPIGSLVILPEDAGPIAKERPTAKMPKAAQIALRALAEAITERGEVPPASNHIPGGIKTVSVSVWRQQAYLRGISESNEDRARQQAFKRAFERLIATGRVGIWDGEVWLP